MVGEPVCEDLILAAQIGSKGQGWTGDRGTGDAPMAFASRGEAGGAAAFWLREGPRLG